MVADDDITAALELQVKPRIQRLTIFQRLGSLSTLMHKCRTTKTPKKNSPRERIAISLIHRMTHLILD